MRALALFSGGLDSMISIKLLTDQGIDVTALHIDIGFGGTKDKKELLEKRAKMVGADFEIIDSKEQFVQEILFNPKYGYGKHFNPCIDCHANMFRIALGLLDRFDASFVITGEVIGQRPMSQRSEAIKNVTKLAGDKESLILRPMSAKLMEPTTPELKGWVDRERLLDIEGRSRETQLRLAKEWGFEEYESPGGGCLLTEDAMATKIKDIQKHGEFKVEDIALLKHGRHLRLPDGAKLVVGRNKDDNEELAKITHPSYSFIKCDGVAGPLSLIQKDASKEDINLAAKIIITYTKTPKDEIGAVVLEDQRIEATPFESKDEIKRYFVLS